MLAELLCRGVYDRGSGLGVCPQDRWQWSLAIGAAGVSVAAASYVMWHLNQATAWPPGKKSPQKNYNQKPIVHAPLKRLGYEKFPLPYPNGWVYICPSDTLERGSVIPIDVCGRQLVAFRTEIGKVGVLDAFCPHMGSHLGYGGYVRNGGIVCPYHQWCFDTDGKLLSMPFGGRKTAEKGADQCNTNSYPTIEQNGFILVWLHADGEKPTWMPEILDRVESSGLRPIRRRVDEDFMMHCMEPSHNACDWYHFKTVHGVLGQHWRSPWAMLRAMHELPPYRIKLNNGVDEDGKPIESSHLLIIDEKLSGMEAFGGLLKVPSWFIKSFSVQVRFNGPLINCFSIKVPLFGEMLTYLLLTPTAPFVTHFELWTFADPKWPWFLAYLLTWFISSTVNQDGEVWEHRMHGVRNTVQGDYDYETYDKWLAQFYSPSSIPWSRAYEDLTW